MKIYTKMGDKGETSLFKGGRVPKYSMRVNTYGTIDELNSNIGWVKSLSQDKGLIDLLSKLQHDLLIIGSDLATPIEAVGKGETVMRIPDEAQKFMEEAIDQMEEKLDPLTQFILPGGGQTAAALHVTRTVARRAERLVTELASKTDINSSVIKYLNRLSDMLFVMARYANKLDGVSDVFWRK